MDFALYLDYRYQLIIFEEGFVIQIISETNMKIRILSLSIW